MAKKKKQETVVAEDVSNKVQFDESQDFKFVQLDSSIYEQKFKTKPTTFLKDAFKRFIKNKSSVVAASILGILILMAIIVPNADRNNIDTNNDLATFLPPKWFDKPNGGFMDGTGKVKDVTLNPDTGYPAADENGNVKYKKEGIDDVSSINVTKTYQDSDSAIVLKYGRGGSISLTADDPYNYDAYVTSPTFNLDLDATYSVKYTIDEEYCKGVGNNPVYSFCVFSDQKASDGTGIFEVGVESSKYGEIVVTDMIAQIKANPSYTSSFTFQSAAVGFCLKASNEKKILYIDNLELKKDGEDVTYWTDNPITEHNVGFSDATAAVSTWKNPYGPNVKGTTVSLYHSEILKGSFTYDYYAAAYCEDEADFTETDLQDFYNKGYLEEEYQWFSKNSGSKARFPGDTKTPATYYTQEECDRYNAYKGYTALTTSTVKTEEVIYTKKDLWEIDGVYYDIDTLDLAELKLTALGEEKCPALKALSVTRTVFMDDEANSLHCTRSRYKYFYYTGLIAECKPIKFFFGTDERGHDFFKVVFAGLLTSLELGVLASIINIIIGIIWGSVSGYFGGWVDMLMERVTEILGGMPFIVLMTLIVLLFEKSNFWVFLFCLCLTGWMGTASVTRSQFYRYRGREYVLASRTLGASDWRLIFLHILPNGIGTIVTSAALMIPSVIFSEASISYLLPGALSFQGATSFGLTLSNAQTYIQLYPYMIVSASIVMSLIMICFNLFGNGLRDAFDPSTKGASI